jgi:hypothetical protein
VAVEHLVGVGLGRQTKTFDVIDLIKLIAADRDWDLFFDSGPGDGRELIFSRTSRFDGDLEVDIFLDFTGRVEVSEYRRDGELYRRIKVDRRTPGADVQLMTFELLAIGPYATIPTCSWGRCGGGGIRRRDAP